MNETIQGLFEDLMIPSDYKSPQLMQLASVDSRYLKDLKLNLSAVLKKSKNLSSKEAVLLGLATAVNSQSAVLMESFGKMAREEGVSEEELAEVHACVSLMNTNNIFYRFRHYLSRNEYYSKTPAGFRMGIMMNPILGKEFFELLSLAISALNNCEACIQSHEASVKQQGASEGKVYDAIRLVAIVKGLVVML